MCGIGSSELIVILVVAVLVLGPERLPEVMRTLGKVAREVRKVSADLSRAGGELRAANPIVDLKQRVTAELAGVERARPSRAETEAEIDELRARLKRGAPGQAVVTGTIAPRVSGRAESADAGGSGGAPGGRRGAESAGDTGAEPIPDARAPRSPSPGDPSGGSASTEVARAPREGTGGAGD